MHIHVYALAASLWLAFPAFATPEPQECSEFPNLAELIEQTDIIEASQSETTAITAALRIEALRKKILTSHMQTRLQELGLSRHLAEVTAFRVRLGALARIARTSGRDGLRPYLFGSGFQQSKQHVRELLERLCADMPSTAPSRDAWREITLWTGTPLSSRPSFMMATGIGLLTLAVLLLATLHSYRRWRQQRDKRIGKRVACDIPVQVSIAGQTQHSTLVDISRGGANLAHQLGLKTGQTLKLTFGETQLKAQVMWANDKFAGTKFERILNNRELSVALKSQRASTRPQKQKRGAQWGTA